MRVVVTTAGGDYGRWVVSDLLERGVEIPMVVMDAHVPTWRTALRRPRRLVGPFRRRLHARRIAQQLPMTTVANLNAPHGIRALRRAAPDVLVLAGARILSAEVLAVPTRATYNAHPARLPGFRGTGVVGSAILAGVPVEVTVHEVAPRVDSGAVVLRRLVPVEPGDTLGSIEDRADRMCTVALADVVAAVAAGEKLHPEPQVGPSRLCTWLDRDQRAEAEAVVASGRPLALYETARAAAG